MSAAFNHNLFPDGYSATVTGSANAHLMVAQSPMATVPCSPDGCYVGGYPTPTSETGTPTPTATHTEVGQPTPESNQNQLPFTGADIGELAIIGVGALISGRLLMIRRKRNKEAALVTASD